jgi:DNA-binding transcriptional ArsR family regulator
VVRPATDLASIGGLLGDRSRARMLAELLDGRARTATELAAQAGVASATASEHLSKLVDGKLLSVEKQGRHRYYRLATEDVARVLEAAGGLAPPRSQAHAFEEDVEVEGLRFARTCYDHLAGRLAVKLRGAFIHRKLLVQNGAEHEVTAGGEAWFTDFGVDLERARREHRSFARACLDWSERRPHIAGALGAAVLNRLLERGWIEMCTGTRAVELTPTGRRGMSEFMDVDRHTSDGRARPLT